MVCSGCEAILKRVEAMPDDVWVHIGCGECGVVWCGCATDIKRLGRRHAGASRRHALGRDRGKVAQAWVGEDSGDVHA